MVAPEHFAAILLDFLKIFLPECAAFEIFCLILQPLVVSVIRFVFFESIIL